MNLERRANMSGDGIVFDLKGTVFKKDGKARVGGCRIQNSHTAVWRRRAKFLRARSLSNLGAFVKRKDKKLRIEN